MDNNEGIVAEAEAELTGAPEVGESRNPTTSGISRTIRRRRKKAAASKRMTNPVTAGDDEAFSVQADSPPACPTPVLQEAPDSRSCTTEGVIHMPKYFVVAFVEALEKASQLYVLKEYIRDHNLIKCGTQWDLICELVVMKEQKGKFNLIDEKEIRNAVQDHLLELSADRYIYLQTITSWQNEKGQGRKNKFSLLVEEDVREDIQDQYLKLRVELVTMRRDIRMNPYLIVPLVGKVVKNDKFATKDPIYDLIVRTQEEGYVLDDNPEVEIEKIKKSGPVYFQARTVTVSNISLDATEENVRAAFGLAPIEYVEMERMPQRQIAHITFKHLSGANYAITITGRSDRRLSMPIRGHGYFRYLPLKVQPREYVESARKEVEDENSMHAKAVSKYRVLRKRLSQSTNQPLEEI